jgi:rhodanese-related sulfurtransferase
LFNGESDEKYSIWTIKRGGVVVKNKILVVLMLIFLTVGLFTTFSLSADVSMITKDELKAMLEKPDLVILDVRLGSDYMSSDLKIKGAVREYGDVGTWVNKYTNDKTLVLYCASSDVGRSVPMAQKIMEKGFTKVYVLKGGWEEWLKAGYPTEKN